MRKIQTVAAAFLTVWQLTTSVAAAAENKEHFIKDADGSLKQKKIEKILQMLKVVGVTDPDILELVQQVDKRFKDGYLTLHGERIGEGTLSLRYEAKPGISVKQFELLYAPDNSHMEYRVRSNAVTVTYRLKF